MDQFIFVALTLVFGFGAAFLQPPYSFLCLLAFIAIAVWRLAQMGVLPFDWVVFTKQQQILNQLKQDNPAQALQLANDLVYTRPQNWLAYHLRSITLLALFRLSDAEKDARMAVRLNPKAHFSYGSLGAILLEQGRYEESKQAFGEALQLGDDFVINHYNLGFVCHRLQEHEASIQYLTTAVRKGLSTPQHMLLANYFLGRSSEALGQSSQAIKFYKAMARYVKGLDQLVNVNNPPGFPEVLALKADVANIERILSQPL